MDKPKERKKRYSDDFIISELPKLREIRDKIRKERKMQARKRACAIEPSEEEECLTRKINCLNNLYHRRKLNSSSVSNPINRTAIRFDSYKPPDSTRYVLFTSHDLNITSSTLESLHNILQDRMRNISIAFFTLDGTIYYENEMYRDVMDLYSKAMVKEEKTPGERTNKLSNTVLAFDVHKEGALTAGANLIDIIKKCSIITDSARMPTIGCINDGYKSIQYYILR